MAVDGAGAVHLVTSGGDGGTNQLVHAILRNGQLTKAAVPLTGPYGEGLSVGFSGARLVIFADGSFITGRP